MKKKLEALMQNSDLADNEAFKKLHSGYQKAKKALEKAKDAKAKAKLAYRDIEEGSDKKNTEKTMTLSTALLQAKSMQQFHRAGFALAEFRLSQWLRNWSKDSVAADSVPLPKKQAATQKTKTPATARKKAPKTADKAVEQ